MEKILNRLIDLPSEVNGKLPWNCWNSCMSDSEGNLASWAGDVFRVGAFVTWVCSVYASLSIMWTGGMGEGTAIIGSILGMRLQKEILSTFYFMTYQWQLLKHLDILQL